MFLFAVEATQGFSLLDFHNNLINWLLLVLALVILGKKLLPPVLSTRKKNIESALKNALQIRKEGDAYLTQQQKKVINAEQEMQNILIEANQLARDMQQQMEEQTKQEIVQLKQKIAQEIENEHRLAVLSLRTQAAKAAVVLTQTTLQNSITDSARARLLDQFMEQLEPDHKDRQLEMSVSK